MTPDMQPILDQMDVPGLFVAVSAYKGLMTAPAAGRLISDLVAGTAGNDPMAQYVSRSRFARGDLIREPMTNGAQVAADS